MLIYMVLLVNLILPVTLAFKKERFIFSGQINTDENATNAKDERSVLLNVRKNYIDSIGSRNVDMPARQMITGTSAKQLEHISRKKRWGAALFTGITTAIHLTGLGLTLAQTLTEGCLYFPSICRNKKRMENLERRLVPMRSEYDKLYLHNKREFVNILKSNTNNAYISYYVNDTVNNINTLQELETILSNKLELKFPVVYAKYTNAQYYTSEEYLDTVVGHLEYRISDIRKMLKDEKESRLKMIAIQYLVGAAITTFVSSYSKAYSKEVLNAGFRKFYAKMYDQAIKNKGLVKKPLLSKTFKSKAQMFIGKVGRAMKAVAKMPYKFAKETYSKLKNPASKKPENKILPQKEIKAQVSDINKSSKDVNKKTAQSNKTKFKGLQTVDAVLGVVGIIAEIVSHVMTVYSWKQTSDKVEKARKDYEKHFVKFQAELIAVRNEKVELAKRWSDVINIFNQSTSVVQTLLEGSKNYTVFNNNVGKAQLPMNTSDQIFSINFQTLNSKTIHAAQEKVKSFIKSIDNDIMRLVDKMYARKVLYEQVLIMTDSNSTIDDIFDTITGILKFSKSDVVKQYGKTLTKKDLMCTISLLCLDLKEYDFFPLNIFRPKCNLSKDEYLKNENIANTLRNEHLLNDIVFKTLNTNKSAPALSDLTESIKNTYFAMNNPELSSFGGRITEKDVICSIATQFQSKEEYDFISLIPFRSNCSKVDKKTFQELKQKSKTIRDLSVQMKSVLNTCKSFKFCPCPTMIANMYQISVEMVTDLIRLIRTDSQMDQYCGTTGCSCVKLK